jgi:phosphoribosyl-ATP pyrophosphohydrolase
MPKPAKKKQGTRPKLLIAKPVKPTKPAKSCKAAVVAPPGPAIGDGARSAVLDRLWQVVLSRRDADPAVSHSARLLSRGPAKVAQKFGEEAVECLIEAVSGNVDALIAESADVLYHLIVVWVAAGVDPADVWAELERREGISGVAEKAARPRDPFFSPGLSSKSGSPSKPGLAAKPGPSTRKIP